MIENVILEDSEGYSVTALLGNSVDQDLVWVVLRSSAEARQVVQIICPAAMEFLVQFI